MSDSADPAIALREQCGNDQECRKYKAALEECTKRVNSTPGTHENCEEELFDFLKCVDHCVAPKLFAKLK